VTGAALVLALAAGVRLVGIEQVDVWFDEAFSFRMAEFSFVEIWQRAGQDTHPPLYFWLLKGWMGLFGHSFVVARVLSMLLGTGAVVAMYLFVKEACCTPETTLAASARAEHSSGDSERTGETEAEQTLTRRARHLPPSAALACMLMVALAPLQIDWSLQVRMYALAALLGAVLNWLVVRTLRRDVWSARAWGLISLVAVLLLYTHNYGMFSVAAAYLYALAYAVLPRGVYTDQSRWSRVWPVVISAFVVYQAWSPWLLTVLEQKSRVADNFWSTSLGWEWLGRAFIDQFLPRGGLRNGPVIGQWILQGTVLLLVIMTLTRRRFDGLVTLAVVVPLAASIAISLSMRNIIIARYLIICNLFILAAAATVLGRIRGRAVRAVAMLLAVASMSWLCWRYLEHRQVMASMRGMHDALAEYEGLRNSDEPLVVSDPMVHACARVYATEPDAVRVYGANDRYPFFWGTAVMTPEDYLDSGAVDALPYEWVWTLDAGDSSSGRRVPMSARWTAVAERRFREYYGELVLRLYRRVNSEAQVKL